MTSVKFWLSFMTGAFTVVGLVTCQDVDVRPTDEPQECRCEFPKHKQPDSQLLQRIRPMCGRRYSVEDDLVTGYRYSVGICATAQVDIDPKLANASVIQVHKPSPSQPTDPTTRIIGSYLQTEIMAGNNWILLEYEGGEIFNSHCAREGKRTVIMILCNRNERTGKMRWIEENNNKTVDCYYLFELEHEAACSPLPTSGLSTGSVVCIIFASLVGAYLVGGVLYMRLVRKAKGLHQIPNYDFWRDFGALQADGCDLICRCGSKSYDTANDYHGIGDHQIDCPNDSEEYDDRLLPM